MNANASCFEIVTYQLQPPAAKAQYLKSVEALNDILPQIEGFISRDVYYCADKGMWAEVIGWKDAQTAKQAMDAIMRTPVFQEGAKLLQMETVALAHYDKVSSLRA